MDAAVQDAGGDRDAGSDAGPPDTGPPDAGPPDAGPPDAGPPPIVCDPVRGIECDGDWADRCTPACGADQCCSPQRGAFACVPRNNDGTCPAADIWVDTARIEDDYTVEYQTFEAASCSIQEACVEAAGRRRLLRFDTWTPNTGGADLYLGPPRGHPELFEFSECHSHYHFNSYARYELRDMRGNVAARGHKQAFCLLDFYRYPGSNPSGGHYTCDNQGIQRDWQDVYGSGLDCQWVDVTDVAPGTYVLRIELNFEGVLLESDYTNNVAEVMVVIPDPTVEPPADVTRECRRDEPRGESRACEMTRQGVHACTPGSTIQVSCSAVCGAGSCTGDPFLRVCDAANDPGCTAGLALGSNDDSQCPGGEARCPGGDCCPRAQAICPASGQVVVFYGAIDTRRDATCDVVVQ